METVKIQLVSENALMPKKQTSGSAAYDVYVPERTQLFFGRQVVSLGIKVEMPTNIGLDCRTRAGYAAKGILVEDEDGNDVRIDADVILGLIDSDYRGVVGAIVVVRDIKLLSNKKYYLKQHQAIGQIKFCYVPDIALVESKELNDTIRGTKGFGEANGE